MNKAKCAHCGDIIESTYRHDYRQCACGAIAVDGGKAYIRRAYKEAGDIIELSEFSEDA